MTKFKWRMLAGLGFIVVAFASLVLYSMRVAPKMGWESKLALNEFYVRCRSHNYKGAHAQLSSTLQANVTQDRLRAKWTEFEAKHGKLTKWAPANISIKGFGGSICVFPPFVDFRHAVSGSKGTGTIIYVRMVPENGRWRLERFNFLK
jgi:hypothetical protein